MPRTVIVKTDTTLRAFGPTLLDARFRRPGDAALERLALNPHADPERHSAGTIPVRTGHAGLQDFGLDHAQAQPPFRRSRAMLTTALADRSG